MRHMLALLECLAKALFLSPTKLNPNASHEPLHENFKLGWSTRKTSDFKNRSRFGRFLAFLSALTRLGRFAFLPLSHAEEDSVAIIADTLNQKRALEPVAKALRQKGIKVCFFSRDFGLTEKGKLKKTETLQILKNRGRLYAVSYLPCLLVNMIVSSGYAQQSYRWALDQHWHTYGIYIACRLWIYRSKPSAILVSNDHIPFICAFVKAGRDQKVPTFYLQHACVTENFPPLSTDYALLDGRDAMHKYAAAGPSKTTAYLVGMPRFDAYADRKNNRSVAERLGICTSKADDNERIEQLLRSLSDPQLKMSVTLRPHPASTPSTTKPMQTLCQELGYDYSSGEETAFDFLARQDVIVAGVSAITLEAALLNVTPIHFSLNDKNSDWYGFVPRELCRSFDKVEELIPYLLEIRQARPDASEQSAYYCESVGTSHNGHSSELAADVIASVVNAPPPTDTHWKRIPCINGFQAYGLR